MYNFAHNFGHRPYNTKAVRQIYFFRSTAAVVVVVVVVVDSVIPEVRNLSVR